MCSQIHNTNMAVHLQGSALVVDTGFEKRLSHQRTCPGSQCGLQAGF